MITQYEVPGYLREVMPQAGNKELTVRAQTNVYTCLQSFTHFTGQAIHDHNMTVARKCCVLAERLYTNGDTIVRNAIENIFVYAFSSFLLNDQKEVSLVKAMIPSSLYHVYVRQMMQSGC